MARVALGSERSGWDGWDGGRSAEASGSSLMEGSWRRPRDAACCRSQLLLLSY
ncbi:hypothetical protein [Propionicimonas sp. T2.31MG-18]|uniref:hypothetical protein n=1 Tax=Propionicimonas sp. T2.31MG-18 TaxID=3157620 RepID=UPI00366E8360